MQSQRDLIAKHLTQGETPNSTSPRRLGGCRMSPLSDLPPGVPVRQLERGERGGPTQGASLGRCPSAPQLDDFRK